MEPIKTHAEGWLTLCGHVPDDGCHCISEHGSLNSSVAFLREKFNGERCDNEAVSCCVRCQVMYLVVAVERIVDGKLRYIPDDEVEARREWARSRSVR